MVIRWQGRVWLMRSKSVARVVLLPAPVGPATTTRPSGRSHSRYRFSEKPQGDQRAKGVFQPADGDGQPSLPAEDVEAIAGAVAAGQGPVQRSQCFQRPAVDLGRQQAGHGVDLRRGERPAARRRLQQPFHAEVRRQVGGQVQIGGSPPHALGQQIVQQPLGLAGRRIGD